MKFKKRSKKSVVGGNQKVKNATRVVYDGIQFRSKLERYMYQQLKDAGFNFEYEKHKLVIFEKFEYLGEKVREITNLPDFLVYIDGKTVIVETKGRQNDSFPIRLKLIKKYLVDKGLNWPYLMPRNQQDCRDVIVKLTKFKENGQMS